jgi:hypothetical protein
LRLLCMSFFFSAAAVPLYSTTGPYTGRMRAKAKGETQAEADAGTTGGGWG